MVDLGFIYMMFLKDYLQYEKQKQREKQRSRKAEKQEKYGKVGKSRKAKKQGNRNQKKQKQFPPKNSPPLTILCIFYSKASSPTTNFPLVPTKESPTKPTPSDQNESYSCFRMPDIPLFVGMVPNQVCSSLSFPEKKKLKSCLSHPALAS